MSDEMIRIIQNAVKAETMQMCADAGMISLGELIARLESHSPNKLVKIKHKDYEAFPGKLHSYRGYYSHLAIESTGQVTTVGIFLPLLRLAVGATFEGYKGGSFTMTRMTPVWFSAYGDASNIGIVGVEAIDHTVKIVARSIKD